MWVSQNTITRLLPPQSSRFWCWRWANVSSPVTMLGNWSTTQPFWNTTQPARAPAPPSGTWSVLPRLLNWPTFLLPLNRPLVLTVHQKDQESRQEGDGVSDGGEVCSVLLDGDHHHRLWHSVQNRGAAQCVRFFLSFQFDLIFKLRVFDCRWSHCLWSSLSTVVKTTTLWPPSFGTVLFVSQ